MSRLMLDTSAYCVFMRGHQEMKAALNKAVQIYLSPIVLGELHAGFQRGTHRSENERGLIGFLSSARVSIAAIDGETALAYAEIVNFLKRAGTPIPTNDIWIAAGAMQHGLRVLTTDSHYKRVPQVIVEHYPV
jgi:tRNA(fMet)-specific endonuclease VapC